MKVNIDKAIESALPLAIGAAIVLGVAYFLIRKTVGEVATGLGGLLSGNNASTKSATNASGETVTAYVDRGTLGTLGAGANAVSGGFLATAGESLGSAWFSVFGPKDTTPKTFYRVRFPDGSYHAVGDTWVDGSGNFSFEGRRYKLGTLSGERVAVAA